MRRVAAFDFDGTLSSRDNVIPFLRRVSGNVAVGRALAIAVPFLAVGRRNRAKRILLARTLRGVPAEDVNRIGEGFAADVVRSHLRDDVVARAAWHRAQGHELVIVSASLLPYLDPIGRRLRLDAVLGTAIEVDAHGRCTGRLAGMNVRGKEKVRRLDAWLGSEPAIVWAYGNSPGDRALLARADHGVRVTRKRLRGGAGPPVR